ncbi:PfkB family carbohydrate kinase [Acidisoma silvae]|uniref:Ribokinase n=1 Tax=Acidisoma silvae TaxID=2802396 RepID=A0A963YN78_9PROT|nr:PfkB family carbohydrate kinase [Acidisoma silvae]MCB8873609.1 bifunctional hydroxymethylpyrimidine kinase/phosphomethylpyrimidine kinase [Acidisoma silvae]
MAIDVLVVGSLHYDILVQSDRLPRTGETFPGSHWMTKCGGKGGNQAVEAARHGAATAMVACIGEDEFGGRLLDNLASSRVDTRFVARGKTGSGMSVAISDPAGDYGAIIVTGSNALIAEADILAGVAELGPDGILVLQNEVPEAANLIVARAARARGARVVINAAPARALAPGLLALIDILIVNAVEAEMLGSRAVEDLSSAVTAAAELSALVPAVIVTAGGDGLALHTAGRGTSIAAHRVALVSTHGAGDAFVGALAAQLARGTELEQAMAYANAAAAVLVSTAEAARAALSPDDTERLLRQA